MPVFSAMIAFSLSFFLSFLIFFTFQDACVLCYDSVLSFFLVYFFLHFRMPVFSAMMVGTVAGVAVLGTTLVSLAR